MIGIAGLSLGKTVRLLTNAVMAMLAEGLGLGLLIWVVSWGVPAAPKVRLQQPTDRPTATSTEARVVAGRPVTSQPVDHARHSRIPTANVPGSTSRDAAEAAQRAAYAERRLEAWSEGLLAFVLDGVR